MITDYNIIKKNYKMLVANFVTNNPNMGDCIAHVKFHKLLED